MAPRTPHPSTLAHPAERHGADARSAIPPLPAPEARPADRASPGDERHARASLAARHSRPSRAGPGACRLTAVRARARSAGAAGPARRATPRFCGVRTHVTRRGPSVGRRRATSGDGSHPRRRWGGESREQRAGWADAQAPARSGLQHQGKRCVSPALSRGPLPSCPCVAGLRGDGARTERTSLRRRCARVLSPQTTAHSSGSDDDQKRFTPSYYDPQPH